VQILGIPVELKASCKDRTNTYPTVWSQEDSN